MLFLFSFFFCFVFLFFFPNELEKFDLYRWKKKKKERRKKQEVRKCEDVDTGVKKHEAILG